MKKIEKIQSKSYTLKYENNIWLGQIVITSDGMFSSVTDYGNFSYAWRSFGDKTIENFEDFLLQLNSDYFASKMVEGMSYIVYTRAVKKACERYAIKILKPLQDEIKSNRK